MSSPAQKRDEQWLHNGWEWLRAHEDHDPDDPTRVTGNHPAYERLLDTWIERLRAYEKTYTILDQARRGGEETTP